MGNRERPSRLVAVADPFASRVARKVTARWATTEPFDRAANEKIDIPVSSIQLHHTGRLVNVQQHERAFRMRVFYDCLRVNTIRTAVGGV